MQKPLKSRCLIEHVQILESESPTFVWITRSASKWKLVAGLGAKESIEASSPELLNEFYAAGPALGYCPYELSSALEPLSRTKVSLPVFGRHIRADRLVSFEGDAIPELNHSYSEEAKEFLIERAKYSLHEFSEMVSLAKNYIEEGDVYQLVLSNLFKLPPVCSSYSLFSSLISLNPSPYHFFIKVPEGDLVGASPETMLKVEADEIYMRPIAGTYNPNSKEGALSSDPKEHAEHVMLVDHVRNDFGRVAKSGTVAVESLLAEETYRTVRHLVSKVRATLAPGYNPFDALFSCFPIATLVGTPSIRAMQLISEIEQHARGYFGGCVCFGDNKSLDSTVFIRSAVCKADCSEVIAGAGIVYDSNPEKEYYECLQKILPFANYYVGD